MFCRRVLSTVCCISAVVLSSGSLSAAIIDLFETSHSTEAKVGAPPSQGTGSVANVTATALGGERDLFVNKTSGADGDRIRARINPLGEKKLRIDVDAEVSGSAFVIWDGPDNNANPFTGVDFDGMGGVDLTAGGSQNAFELVVTFSDVRGPI